MDRHEWDVEVRDFADRERRMRVVATPDDVTLALPPGGSAAFSPATARAMAAILAPVGVCRG